MKEEMKDAMIASVDAVQAIEDFLTDWWSVNELYETSAKAISELMSEAQKNPNLMSSEMRDYINQHIMMIDLLKSITKKEDLL